MTKDEELAELREAVAEARSTARIAARLLEDAEPSLVSPTLKRIWLRERSMVLTAVFGWDQADEELAP